LLKTRALASLITAFTTVIGMAVYQHYSREPPSETFAVAVTMAASVSPSPTMTAEDWRG
jgi:hypothetical protein